MGLPFKSYPEKTQEKYEITDGAKTVLPVPKLGSITPLEAIAYEKILLKHSGKGGTTEITIDTANMILASRFNLDPEADHLVTDEGDPLPYAFVQAVYQFFINETNMWKEPEQKDAKKKAGKA